MIRYLFLTFAMISSSYAQWSTDPTQNLIVGYGESPQIASDSAGGCYVSYENYNGQTRLYLERLNRYGYRAWGSRRQLVGAYPTQSYARIVADGSGGVIVSYLDAEFFQLGAIWRLRVQRVDSTGNFLWGPIGVRVSLSETNHGDNSIAPDGKGGCIVAWVDTLNELRINRINQAGARMWGDSGRHMWNSDVTPLAVADGRGGCYIRFGVGRLQRFNSIGNSYWPSPIQVPTSGGTLRVDPIANLYLLGRKVLGYRNGELLFTVNLQKVDTTGCLLWDSLGVVLDTINSNNAPLARGLALNEIYSWVCWPQQIANQWDLRMQVVRSDATTIFPLGGNTVSRTYSDKQLVATLSSDSLRSLFIWNDFRSMAGTYAQRLDTLGQAKWDTNDIAVSVPYLADAKATCDGSGGVIIAGTRENFSIRVQQVSKNGNLGQVITHALQTSNNSFPTEPVLFQNYPNPFNSATIIRYWLPSNGRATLRLFNLLGQELKIIEDRFHPQGVYSISVSANELASGIYFYALATSHVVSVRKLTIIK